MRCLDDHRQAKFGHGLLGQRLLRLRITLRWYRTPGSAGWADLQSSQMRLVMTLSMPMLEAITPEPV